MTTLTRRPAAPSTGLILCLFTRCGYLAEGCTPEGSFSRRLAAATASKVTTNSDVGSAQLWGMMTVTPVAEPDIFIQEAVGATREDAIHRLRPFRAARTCPAMAFISSCHSFMNRTASPAPATFTLIVSVKLMNVRGGGGTAWPRKSPACSGLSCSSSASPPRNSCMTANAEDNSEVGICSGRVNVSAPGTLGADALARASCPHTHSGPYAPHGPSRLSHCCSQL